MANGHLLSYAEWQLCAQSGVFSGLPRTDGMPLTCSRLEDVRVWVLPIGHGTLARCSAAFDCPRYL